MTRPSAVMAAGLILLLWASAAGAQAPGDSVRLTLRDGSRVEGTLLERSGEVWRLTVPPSDARLVPVPQVQRADRRIVRTRSQLRSQSMALGMLVGFGAMYAVYATEIKSSDGSLGNLLIIPLGVAGAGAGAIIGIGIGSTRPVVVWRRVR